MLAGSGVDTYVTRQPSARRPGFHTDGTLCRLAAAARPQSGTRVAIHPGTAKITFTSGSTGRPKGVCLSAAASADDGVGHLRRARPRLRGAAPLRAPARAPARERHWHLCEPAERQHDRRAGPRGSRHRGSSGLDVGRFIGGAERPAPGERHPGAAAAHGHDHGGGVRRRAARQPAPRRSRRRQGAPGTDRASQRKSAFRYSKATASPSAAR